MRVISYFKKKEQSLRKVAKRDYYQEKKKSSWSSWLVFLAVSATFLIYLFVFSPYCKVNNLIIEIEDYPTLRYSLQEIESIIKKIASEKYLFFIPKDSLIIFPTKKLARILKNDKCLENFSLKKEAPDILKVSLKVFEPQAILSDLDGKIYLLNKAGERIKEVKEPSIILPLIENRFQVKKNFGAIVDFINSVNKNFDFKIEKVEIYKKEGVETNKAQTSEKWDIYFDEKENLEEQLTNLFLVLREKIKDRQDLSYIDLRFNNKIFYK